MSRYPKTVTCPCCNCDTDVEPADPSVGIMRHSAVCANEDCRDYLMPITVEPFDDYTEPMFPDDLGVSVSR